MKISIKNSKGATEDELQALEAQLGFAFPAAYRVFIKINHGGRLRSGGGLIPAHGGIEALEFFDFDTFEEILRKRALPHLPRWAIPVAFDSGGNFYCFDKRKPEVIRFWDHEEFDGQTPIVAPNFESFLDMIEPDE